MDKMNMAVGIVPESVNYDMPELVEDNELSLFILSNLIICHQGVDTASHNFRHAFR